MMRAFAFLVLLVAGGASAQAPQKLGYQGLLLKTDGTPETGTVSIAFSIYADPTGGSSLWNESQTIALSLGYYATYLGEVTPLPANLFDGSDRYLELAVNSSTLSPRMRLASVPYAISAATAHDVSGGTVNASTIQVAGNTVIDSNGKLTGSAAFDAGTGITIAGNTIQVTACNAGEVLRYSGAPANAWQCTTIAPSSGDAGVVAYTADSNGGLQLLAPDFTAFSMLRGCTMGQMLKWNGTAWACADDANSITNVAGTAPIAVANGGSAPNISMTQATSSTNGWLSSSDWASFNAKGAGTVTNVTGAAPIAVATGGTTPAISITQAGTGTNGFLSSTDWNTFNGKGAGTVTSVSGTAPISVATGTSTPAISMTQAGTAANGWLSSTDWNTFNGKAPASGSANYAPASGSANYAPASGSASYIQNQTAAAQGAGFNISGGGTLAKLGIGMAATYLLDVAVNGTLDAARFGSPPVTIGPGTVISWNDNWNGGFATNQVAGFAASLAFDTASGRFLLSNTAASLAAGTTHGYSPFMVINGDGKAGFAIPFPYTLSNAFTVGSGATNGNGAFLSVTGTWTNTSTRTKKTEIRPETNALSILEQVKVYRYRFKMPNGGDDGRDHLGVIAEELPDVVASQDHMGAPTGELIGLALGADRELAAKVKTLESENAKQAKLIAELSKRLDALEGKRK